MIYLSRALAFICICQLYQFLLSDLSSSSEIYNDTNLFYVSNAVNSTRVSYELQVDKRHRYNPTSSLQISSILISGCRQFKRLTIALILIRLTDIEVNPGPSYDGSHITPDNLLNTNITNNSWTDPSCHSCTVPIKWDDDSVFCSGCDSWYHAICVNNENFNDWSDQWICDKCIDNTVDNTSVLSDEATHDLPVNNTSNNDPALHHGHVPASASSSLYLNLSMPSKGLRFGQWNVNYLTNAKYEQIKLMLTSQSSKQLDVLFLIETFLKPTNSSSSFNIPGYTLLRKDRFSKHGGGVAAYCSNDLNYRRRLDLEEDSVEVMWLEVYPYRSKRSLLLAGCYRPPSSSKDDDSKFEKVIERTYLKSIEVILTGDFNIDFINTNTYNKNKLAKSLSHMNFNQVINSVTRPISGSCLDHIYTNHSKRICNVVIPNYALSDHLPVFAVRKFNCHPSGSTKLHKTFTYRDIRKLNVTSFRSSLSSTPWDTAFIVDSIDDCVDSWENLFMQTVDSLLPLKEKRVSKDKQPQWMTNEILDAIKKRDNLMSKARSSNHPDCWKLYRAARNSVVSKIEQSKRTYFKTSFRENKGNPKTVWKFLKSLGSHSTGPNKPPISLSDENNIDIRDAKHIANIFNGHFTSIASKLKTSMNLLNIPNLSKLKTFILSKIQPDATTFSIPTISTKEVINYLSKIPSNKATGVDGISPLLLKIGVHEIAPSIVKLINMSLSCMTFPSRWKTAKVTPLFKAGSTADVNNYRPISVLPVISKIIERHVHESLSSYLSDNGLIYSKQSGFRKKHSTETALAFIIDTLLFNIDKNKINGLVLVDFKKAFDMVDHEILQRKLELYGFDNNSLKWFQSYLFERRQYVVINNEVSTTTFITDGIPQGSILGPLLFVIFINDLPLHIDSRLDIFADDTTILESSMFTRVGELEEKLSASASQVDDWAKENKLPLNAAKTKTLLVSGKRLHNMLSPSDMRLNVRANGIALEQCNNAKLLGIVLDENLSFDLYIDSLCSKISKRLGILKHIKSYLPIDERLLFYSTMIKPLFLYAAITWSNCSKNNLFKLLKLQKRAARIILDAHPQHQSVDLFNRLKWIPFYREAEIRKCILAYKRCHNQCPDYLNELLPLNSDHHNRRTRNAHCLFRAPRYNRVTEGGRTFSVSTMKYWNTLSHEIRISTSINTFKKALFVNIFNQQQDIATFKL